jgi:hypothetical protein
MRQMMSAGFLEPEEREKIITEWCKAHHVIRRPPFFAKDFMKLPPTLIWGLWFLVNLTHHGAGGFCRLCSPRVNAQYDLLVKEVGGARHTRAILQALDPELIVIFRHPYAVVASVLRGQRLGLLSPMNRAGWLRHYDCFSQQLGFNPHHVLEMEECEFLALRWLIVNMIYQSALKEHTRSCTVVYEKLRLEPLDTTKSVFRFLNWDMNGQTTRFLEESTQKRTAGLRALWHSGHSFFGIYRDHKQAIESWQNELTPQARAKIAAIVTRYPFTYWADQEPWS